MNEQLLNVRNKERNKLRTSLQNIFYNLNFGCSFKSNHFSIFFKFDIRTTGTEEKCQKKDIPANSILPLYIKKYSRNNVYVNECCYKWKNSYRIAHIFRNMQICIQNVYSHMLYWLTFYCSQICCISLLSFPGDTEIHACQRYEIKFMSKIIVTSQRCKRHSSFLLS